MKSKTLGALLVIAGILFTGVNVQAECDITKISWLHTDRDDTQECGKELSNWLEQCIRERISIACGKNPNTGAANENSTQCQKPAIIPTSAPQVTPDNTQTTTASPEAGVTAKPTATGNGALEATPQATQITATKTVSATPVPTSAVEPSGNVSALAAQMLRLINEERVSNGLGQLAMSDILCAGALSHSRDMSANGFFSHTSPTNETFAERARAFGVSAGGENIALYGSIEQAHSALMASDGHRANILGVAFSKAGISVVYNSQKHGYYITQWFSR